jgi:hypothetical protein
MHLRIASDWARPIMMLKPVPVAPLGARAVHVNADADVETAVVITNPTKIATKKRLMITLPYSMHEIVNPRCGP